MLRSLKRYWAGKESNECVHPGEGRKRGMKNKGQGMPHGPQTRIQVRKQGAVPGETSKQGDTLGPAADGNAPVVAPEGPFNYTGPSPSLGFHLPYPFDIPWVCCTPTKFSVTRNAVCESA